MNPEISIVIPIFNEEENIFILSSAIHRAMVDIIWPYECIFVDDGSINESHKEMKKVCGENDNFRIVRLRENYGQTAALNTGFKASRGKYIVMMDVDLQNDPFDILLLLAEIDCYGMVYGWRFERQDPLIKIISAKVANYVRNKLTSENIRT